MIGDYTAEFARPRGCGQGKVRYRGRCMTPNKPVPSSRPEKKRMVLVKRGDRMKLVHYGAKGYSDYRKHKDPARRARFQKRHRAIKLKDGRPAHSDPFQPAYWSTKKAGGTWGDHLDGLVEFKRGPDKKPRKRKTFRQGVVQDAKTGATTGGILGGMLGAAAGGLRGYKRGGMPGAAAGYLTGAIGTGAIGAVQGAGVGAGVGVVRHGIGNLRRKKR